ncbi:MAG TPA: PIN domain-containing protein [Candidatus Acidoferrum sp.]|nr:PIN domain-containing protein [Candidatus Acidoferrum sp.]
MKTQFSGFYRPTEADFRRLWKTCIFALDANVLLNLYGYSEKTREEFLGLLERLASRICMPHQFALEYQLHRARAIMEQVKNYAKAEKVLTELYDEEFAPKHKHPFLSEKLLRQFGLIRQDLAKSRKKHEALFTNDPYFDRITAALRKVGSAPTDQQLGEMYAKAKARYTLRVPPGFADLKEKGEPSGYGDCVGWFELMEMSKSESKPAILVTDDAKEDWWHIQGDRTIGPRPELLMEFLKECQQSFYMYSSDQFMKYARTYLEEQVEQGAIEEIKERLQEELRQKTGLKPKASAGAVTPRVAEKPTVPPEPLKPQDAKAVAQQRPREQQKTASPRTG